MVLASQVLIPSNAIGLGGYDRRMAVGSCLFSFLPQFLFMPVVLVLLAQRPPMLQTHYHTIAERHINPEHG